ncbi:hypothetical protein [Ornithinimicrobium avium]|uniref:Uncharacterized protein n=1 Tax=Ornithinimicrobium avium TaxID=2283195 RepID=A0A345NRK0_9MICO|nr:hypothetical protein [Ornithinimicrobium avium]AXH97658.1 hypothetical protein DV701_17460 [Ornithinimicrobium avium]
MKMTIVNLTGASVDTHAAVLPATGGARLRAFRPADDAAGGRGSGFGTARTELSPTPVPVLDVTPDPTS